MKKLCVFIVLFGLANITPASITCEWKDSITDLGNGLYSITFTLVSDNKKNIAAFDGGFTCSNMNQNWIDSLNITTPLQDILGKDTFDKYDLNETTDSHFLLTSGQIISKNAPSESHTTLSGTFGILPESEGGISTTRLALAQIVLNENDTFVFDAKVSDTDGNLSTLHCEGSAQSKSTTSGGTDTSGGSDTSSGTDNSGGTTSGTDTSSGTDNNGDTQDLTTSGCTGLGLTFLLTIIAGFGFISTIRK